MEQWDKVEQALVSAIEVCRSTFSLAAGSFMGSLAGLYAQQLKIEEAKELLLEGEPLVEVYPEEHGKFLCKNRRCFNTQMNSIFRKRLSKRPKQSQMIWIVLLTQLRRLIETTEEQFQSSHSLSSNTIHKSKDLELKGVPEEQRQQLKMQSLDALGKGKFG